MPLPPAEQIDLCLHAQKGDAAARQKLVQTNLRFLYGHAKRFAAQTSLLEVDDLMSEGVIGLFRAIDKFDATRGERFLTYATYWVQCSMREAVVQTAIRIAAPLDVLTRVWANRFARDRQELVRRGTSDASLETSLAKVSGMTPQRLRAAENLRQPSTSMDQTLADETARSLHDVLSDSEPSVEERLSDKRWVAQIHTTIALVALKMPFTKRLVLAERILGRRPLGDVGAILDLSRERVRQIEMDILYELREILRADFPTELGSKLEPAGKRGWRNLPDFVR